MSARGVAAAALAAAALAAGAAAAAAGEGKPEKGEPATRPADPGPMTGPVFGGPPTAETRPRRSGFALGVGLGPSILIGLAGGDRFAGVGGAIDVRFGTTASERLLWFLDAEAAAYQVPDENDKLLSRTQTTLTLGGHYYVREVLWFGAGIGVAAFRSAQSDPAGGEDNVRTLKGLALRYSGGIDLLHRGIFALSAELGLAAGLYDGDRLSNLTLRLAGSWY